MTTVYRKYNESDKDIWNKIVEANESIKTITLSRKKKNADGTFSTIEKEYAEVNQRIKAFRYVYPKGRIETKIISLEGEVGKRIVLMRCEVYDDLGNLLSVDYAEEKEAVGVVNSTSFIENCSTSVTGRALAYAGFGIDTAVASYEEVKNATEYKKPTINKLSDLSNCYSTKELNEICKKYGVEKEEDLPREVVNELIKERKDILKAKTEEIEKALQHKPLDKESDENPFY